MENISLQHLTSSILSLSVTAVLLFLLPIVYVVFWKKHCGKSVSLVPLFLGAAGFIVSVRILELGVHMICIVMDNPISRFINGSTPFYVLYGTCMAGIFEECGRYIIFRFLMKKNKTKENFVMYGIGHGGIEVWSITLLSVISLLVIAVMIRGQGMAAALQGMGISASDPAVSALLTTVVNFGPVTAGLYIVERIFAMTAHISLTIIVAYGVANRRKSYLAAAIFAHAVFDIFPALYQRGAVSMLATELWLLVCTVAIAAGGTRLYRKWTVEKILPGKERIL